MVHTWECLWLIFWETLSSSLRALIHRVTIVHNYDNKARQKFSSRRKSTITCIGHAIHEEHWVSWRIIGDIWRLCDEIYAKFIKIRAKVSTQKLIFYIECPLSSCCCFSWWTMVTNSRLVAILSTIYGKSGRRTDWHVKNSILWLVQNDVIDRALCGGNKHDSKFHQVEWECYVIRNISRIQFWKWRLKAQRTQFFHSGRKLWNSRTIMERLKRKKDLLWTNLRRPQSEWSQHALLTGCDIVPFRICLFTFLCF